MATTKTLLTVEELDRMTPPDGVRYELDEGELVEVTFPRLRHNYIADNAYQALRRYARSSRSGRACPADSPFMLRRSPDTLRGPDAAFVSNPRGSETNVDAVFEGAPDLAVEVVSPTDTASGLRRKVRQYLLHGSKAVWVLYPEESTVEVHTASGTVELNASATLTAPELLPGFSVAVSDLFQID